MRGGDPLKLHVHGGRVDKSMVNGKMLVLYAADRYYSSSRCNKNICCRQKRNGISTVYWLTGHYSNFQTN